MTGRDDIILEFLDESGAILNKKALEINLNAEDAGISYSTIQRRLPKLKEAGLVELVIEEGTWYRITDRGQAYLQGKADLRDEPEPNA
ncbi:winged helix-turn-helix transcriptional regulator [Halomicrobium sp. IBSBa]|uniref:winged helix-turn-helix domain-containing protein n=1 Tax=Halomicrobium sp. IBSBa TaxID=2778916 RepID=UPI001ABFEAAA|nr:winged helix-turn-helix domain-containing protein [Halomicrobium sp. IBSBa]MBO4248398.1 winged helix-turn-helix transcriptional regulator [Halomicrobium sp. IBSBa]